MSMTPENGSVSVRDNDVDTMLSLLIGAAFARYLDFRSSVVGHRKRGISL